MIIRRDQMRNFERYMKASFEDRMVRHLAESFPAEYARLAAESGNDEAARALVRMAVDKSARIKARRESSIQQMLEIMVRTKPDFEADPEMAWAREILADETLAGGTRILLVHQKLPGHLAPAAQTNERGTY